MDTAYFRAYRPSSFAPARDDLFEEERRKMREARIEQYADRAKMHRPLFEEPQTRRSA